MTCTAAAPKARRQCFGPLAILAVTYLVHEFSRAPPQQPQGHLKTKQVPASAFASSPLEKSPREHAQNAHQPLNWPPLEPGDPQAVQKTEARAQAARVASGGLEVRGLERTNFNGLYTLVRGDAPNGRPRYIRHMAMGGANCSMIATHKKLNFLWKMQR